MGETVCSDTEIGKPDGSESRVTCGMPPVTPKHFRQPDRTIKNAIGALRGLNGG